MSDDNMTVIVQALSQATKTLHEAAQAMREPQLQPISVRKAQAAAMLGFKDPASIDRLVQEGKIRVKKCGRAYLYSVRSLRQYIDGKDMR